MSTIKHWINATATAATSTRTAPVFNPATGAAQAEVLLAENPPPVVTFYEELDGS